MNVVRSASFSRCGKYRYQLVRQWDDGDGCCVFIGLNPSTADHRQDDPTIRRCMGFARRWGHQKMVMINLFAYRTPHPAELKQAPSPEGKQNRRVLRRHCQSENRIVAAWGAHGILNNQAARLSDIWSGNTLYCFGLTAGGQPLHPLYQRSEATLSRFKTALK